MEPADRLTVSVWIGCISGRTGPTCSEVCTDGNCTSLLEKKKKTTPEPFSPALRTDYFCVIISFVDPGGGPDIVAIVTPLVTVLVLVITASVLAFLISRYILIYVVVLRRKSYYILLYKCFLK